MSNLVHSCGTTTTLVGLRAPLLVFSFSKSLLGDLGAIDSEVTYSWTVNGEVHDNVTAQFSYQFAQLVACHTKVVASDEEYSVEQSWSVAIPVNNDDNSVTPLITGIVSNYPNPFNPHTTIQYCLHQASMVEINIYNLKGAVIKRLHSGYKDIGQHTISWDGLNDRQESVASGVYYIRMKCAEQSFTRKITLMK